MNKEIHHGRKNGMTTKNRKEWAQSVEELFSDLLAEAHTLDPDMKMCFVEAFFYIGQRDIRQAMADFDTLGDADRLVAGYLLRNLARKAQPSPEQALSGIIGRSKRSTARLRRPSAAHIALKG